MPNAGPTGILWLAFAGALALSGCSSPRASIQQRHVKPIPVTAIGRLPFTNVVSVTSGPMGLYLLRQSRFPGDPSGAGYEVDLVAPTSGRIMASTAGDACPAASVNAFGSVWVLTENCAMPGGLGAGVDRLDANTLAHEARITRPAGLGFASAIGATASTVWVLQSGSVYGPAGLMGIDPATNSVTRTKAFGSGELDLAMGTTADRVVVGGEMLTKGAIQHTIFVEWISDSTLRVASDIAVTRTVAGPVFHLAATNDTTVYVGLIGVGKNSVVNESLGFVRRTKVFVRANAGAMVSASSDGEVWTAHSVLLRGAPLPTWTIQRIGADDSVRGQFQLGETTVDSISALGPYLYVGTTRGVLVLK